jgi:hypothetical protein
MLNGSPSTVGEIDRRLKEGSIVAPFKAQYVPSPHAPGKKSLANIGLQSFLVFRQEKDLDRTRGAMQLGYSLTDNPAQKAITVIGQLPVRKSVGNIYPDDSSRTTALAALDNGRQMGAFPDNGEIRSLLLKEVSQTVFNGQRSVRTSLDEFCRLSEPVMARNR